MTKSVPTILLAVFALSGCSSAPSPPISVGGVPSAVASLAGQWDGQYRTSDGGRRGTIVFDLARGDTVATGSVIMASTQAQSAGSDGGAGTAPPGATSPRPTTESLSVRFVQVENGMVRGRLAPYTDPECACLVETVFDGRLKDDLIEGSFTIRNTLTGTTRVGQWSAKRHAADVQH